MHVIFLALPFCNLLNDAVNNSEYIVSDDWLIVNNELGNHARDEKWCRSGKEIIRMNWLYFF
jgi:hypothetical protein